MPRVVWSNWAPRNVCLSAWVAARVENMRTPKDHICCCYLVLHVHMHSWECGLLPWALRSKKGVIISLITARVQCWQLRTWECEGSDMSGVTWGFMCKFTVENVGYFLEHREKGVLWACVADWVQCWQPRTWEREGSHMLAVTQYMCKCTVENADYFLEHQEGYVY